MPSDINHYVNGITPIHMTQRIFRWIKMLKRNVRTPPRVASQATIQN